MENDKLNVQEGEVAGSDSRECVTEQDVSAEEVAEAAAVGDKIEDSLPEDNSGGVDEDYAYYERLERDDLLEIKREFIEASDIGSISELDNPERFCELRELGLSPREAYLATQRKRADSRSHLKSRVPLAASAPRLALTQRELESARELFSGISDAEIQELYKKVSR